MLNIKKLSEKKLKFYVLKRNLLYREEIAKSETTKEIKAALIKHLKNKKNLICDIEIRKKIDLVIRIHILVCNCHIGFLSFNVNLWGKNSFWLTWIKIFFIIPRNRSTFFYSAIFTFFEILNFI